MDHKPAAGPPRAHRLTTAALEEDPARLGAEIAGAARRRGGLLLCSDFDGTLAPIVARPEEAHALPASAAVLAWLSRGGAGRAQPPVHLAIVTSRDAADIGARLALGPEAAVVASGGMERWVDGRGVVHADVAPFLPALERAAQRLGAAIHDGPLLGARVERKACAVVLHTRGATAPGAGARAAQLAGDLARELGLRAVAAKRAVELRPPVDRDKATAVLELLDEVGGDPVLCVAGDDLPDVPMLRVASTRTGGVAVAVRDVETPEIVVDAATDAVLGPWGWSAALVALERDLRSG